MNIWFNLIKNSIKSLIIKIIKDFSKNYFKSSQKINSKKDIILYTYIIFFLGSMTKTLNQQKEIKIYIKSLVSDNNERKSLLQVFIRGQKTKIKEISLYLIKFRKSLLKNRYHNQLFEQLYEITKNEITFHQHIIFKTIINTLEINCPLYESIYNKIFFNITQAYKLLNCQVTDSITTIKKSYRLKSQKYHPDKANKEQQENFKTQFQDIQIAYKLIMEQIN